MTAAPMPETPDEPRRSQWFVPPAGGFTAEDLDRKAYSLTGIHHERLKLTVPFQIDIDLTEIEKL
jgi:hypothetical protein